MFHDVLLGVYHFHGSVVFDQWYIILKVVVIEFQVSQVHVFYVSHEVFWTDVIFCLPI